jgi:hypothetical protein
LITLKILDEYRSLCGFHHSPVIPYLIDPDILLYTLFSNILSLLSSLIVSNQFSHPYKTTGKKALVIIKYFYLNLWFISFQTTIIIWH